MMQVGISAEFLGVKSCGPETYTRNLLYGLSQIEGKHQFFPYLAAPQARALVPPALNLTPRMVRPYSAWVRIPVTLPMELLRRPVDLFHAQQWGPLWGPCPLVVTIHDLSWKAVPQTYPKALRWRLSYLVKATVKKSLRVITSSRSTTDDLMRLYNVPAEKIRLIYPALDSTLAPVTDPEEISRVRASYSISRPYILYFGVIEPKKNVDRLIRAYVALRRERWIPHQLVIAGRAGWLSESIFALVDSLRLREDIIVTGEVPQHNVAALYSGAEVFAYLSSAEGFGYPPLEAMAYGVPVLAADRTSLPEVLADGALLVDPLNDGQVTSALRDLLIQDDLRKRLRMKGFERVRQFHPTAAARQVVAVYEECYAEIRGAKENFNRLSSAR